MYQHLWRSIGATCMMISAGLFSALSYSNTDGPNKTNTLDAMTMFEHHVAIIAREVKTGWSQSNTVWPGANFDKVGLVVNNGQPDTAWYITTTTVKRLHPKDAQRLYKPGKFAFDKHKGQKIVVINGQSAFSFYQKITKHGLPDAIDPAVFYGGIGFDRSTLTAKLKAFHAEYRRTRLPATHTGITAIFYIGTHEAFHRYVQTDQKWKVVRSKTRNTSGRFNHYPAPSKPRAYRGLTLGALRDAYYDPKNRQAYLSAAAYWYNQWQSEYSEEYQNTAFTDNREGSARYFEMAIAAVVIQATNPYPTYGEAAIAHLKSSVSLPSKLKRRGPTPIQISASIESYVLGAIAGLLADSMGINWQEQLALFKRPAEIVLEGIDPVAQAFPKDDFSSAKDLVRQREASLTPLITPFLARVKSPQKNDIYVFFSAQKQKGSVRKRGRYLPEESPDGLMVSIGVTGEFELEGGAAKLTKANLGAHVKQPCDRRTSADYLIVIPEDTIKPHGDSVTIETKGVSIKIAKNAISETVYLGRKALCLSAKNK